MSRVAVLPTETRQPDNSQKPRRCSWRTIGEPVEWSGSYSVDKLLCLLSTSPRRCSSLIATLLLTPLSSLLMPLLLNLIPLNDPSLGWRGNRNFIARWWLRASILPFTVDNQIQFYIPELTIPHRRMLLMNFLQGASMAVILVAVSTAIRIFPVPFMEITTAPLYIFCLKIWRRLFTSSLLKFQCDLMTARELTRMSARVVRMFSFTIILLLVYSLFGTGFEQVPERFQSILLIGLVPLKMFATRSSWRQGSKKIIQLQ